jgi:hypothetical protein
MEYLMTYGWAIVILAVVLGALAYLGVFNPIDYAPKAQPGACSVYRPFGPNTTTDINTAGVCNNEIPQYVADFVETATSGSNIIVPDSGVLDPTNKVTITLWIKPSSQIPLNPGGTSYHLPVSKGVEASAYDIWGGNGNGPPEFQTEIQAGGVVYDSPAYIASVGKWYFVVGTYDGSHVHLYVDGSEISPPGTPASGQINEAPVDLNIGSDGNSAGTRYYNGTISNVQIYNTALDSNNIEALYAEGIGGAPIDLQNLVGWWPLNGNANDYSGNGNNGTPVNVIFTTNWYNGYSQP